MQAKKGRLVIDFATLEDLERIYRAMTESGGGRALDRRVRAEVPH